MFEYSLPFEACISLVLINGGCKWIGTADSTMFTAPRWTFQSMFAATASVSFTVTKTGTPDNLQQLWWSCWDGRNHRQKLSLAAMLPPILCEICRRNAQPFLDLKVYSEAVEFRIRWSWWKCVSLYKWSSNSNLRGETLIAKIVQSLICPTHVKDGESLFTCWDNGIQCDILIPQKSNCNFFHFLEL